MGVRCSLIIANCVHIHNVTLETVCRCVRVFVVVSVIILHQAMHCGSCLYNAFLNTHVYFQLCPPTVPLRSVSYNSVVVFCGVVIATRLVNLLCAAFSQCPCCIWAHVDTLTESESIHIMIKSTAWFMISEFVPGLPPLSSKVKYACSQVDCAGKFVWTRLTHTHMHTHTHAHTHTPHMYTDAQSPPSVWSYTSKAAENRF